MSDFMEESLMWISIGLIICGGISAIGFLVVAIAHIGEYLHETHGDIGVIALLGVLTALLLALSGASYLLAKWVGE